MRKESEWKSFHVRPEDEKSVKDFYDASEAERYSQSNAMGKIQGQLTLRAIDIARFPLGSKIIDAGCGAGFSCEVLRGIGYGVFPFDVLPVFVEKCREKGFNAKLGDIRKFPFHGEFDGIVSISVLQWVTASDVEQARKVAAEFWSHLKKGGKAVVQFYPKSENELMQTGHCFKQRGFKTTAIIDNPSNPRKRKVFLLLEKVSA